MKKIVIASHGMLAEGFKNTLEILGISQDGFIVMNFYCPNGSTSEDVIQCIEELEEQDQLVICTDIQYGSVNQMFMKEAIKRPEKSVFLVTGVNLPMLLEIATCKEELSTILLSAMVKKAAKQLALMDVEQLMKQKTEEDIF